MFKDESNFQHKDTQNVQLMKISGIPSYEETFYCIDEQLVYEYYLLLSSI